MKKNHSPKSSRVAAVTLVELLVVVGVVMILAVIGFAGMQKAGDFRDNAQCVANLREIGVRFHQYALTNEGYFPAPKAGGESWWMVLGKMENDKYDVLRASDNKVFLCPAAKLTYPNGKARRTYGMNAEIGTQTNSVKVMNNTYPTRTLVVADMKSNPAEPVDAQFLFRATKEPKFSTYVDARHNGRFNGLFVDGHVESLSPDDPELPEMIQNAGK